MEIEQRLQLTIGFVRQAPTSTESDLITFLVSKGDVTEEAEAALPLYLGMMLQFGFLTDSTYEAMRDWGNSHTIEQITVATGAMLVAYNKIEEQARVVAEAEAELTIVQSRLAELEGVETTDEELLAFSDNHPLHEAKAHTEQQISNLEASLVVINSDIASLTDEELIAWSKVNNDDYIEHIFLTTRQEELQEIIN